jgi:hypothetical protein
MRRELRFKTFEEALAELERLEQGPVTPLGNWSFFQALDHCAGAIRFSMGGTPLPRPGWKRRLTGWIFKKITLWKGSIRAGVQNPRVSSQRVEGDAVETAQRLRETIKTFQSYNGPWTPHPFFGRLTKAEWEKIHIYHMANHFGFLERQK